MFKKEMPFSNHQFSLRCLFWWEVPQMDCCQCLDQYRFVAILKNDTGKKKTKTTPCLQHILISPCFFSEKLLATLFDAWKSHFFGPRNIPSKSLVMRNSLFTVTSHWCCKPQTHALGNPKKILPLLRRKFGQSEPRSQEIRKRSSWEKAKASMPWSCSSRGDVWSS